MKLDALDQLTFALSGIVYALAWMLVATKTHLGLAMLLNVVFLGVWLYQLGRDREGETEGDRAPERTEPNLFAETT